MNGRIRDWGAWRAIVFLCIFCTGISCQKKYDLEIMLCPSEKYQTMHSFGASDAWHAQFVGKNWPACKKEQIADWLFSREFDSSGNPKGIGLSLWRFNIGAGSTEIGDKSKIEDTWKRMECFLTPDGKYDWNKQSGQQWFMKAAKERGVEYLLAFLNSAPYFMTRNGSTYSPDSVSINLKGDRYDDFACFLADVMEHFNEEGLFINYLSPLNEPQVNWWIPRQEGTFATNEECYRVLKSLDKEFRNRNLPNKIVFGEAASYAFLYSDSTYMPLSDNQIDEFFTAGGNYSLLSFSSVLPIISGHPYWTTWNLDTLVNIRTDLFEKRRRLAPNTDFWSSEYCVLEKNEWMPEGGSGRDLSMHTALYVSRIIHADITLAGASSWQWWLGITPGDFKDGLIYIDRCRDGVWKISSGEIPDSLKYDGYCRSSKILWAFGNYSRFVRPGMVRIGLTRNDRLLPVEELRTVMTSAYRSPVTGKSVVIITNLTSEFKRVGIEGIGRFKVYCTDRDKDLAYTGCRNDGVLIPAESIVTLVEE